MALEWEGFLLTPCMNVLNYSKYFKNRFLSYLLMSTQELVGLIMLGLYNVEDDERVLPAIPGIISV